MILPALLNIAIFSLIPLGEPNQSLKDKLVWILYTNPLTMTVLAVLASIIFFAVLDEEKPWRNWRLVDTFRCAVARCAAFGFPYP